MDFSSCKKGTEKIYATVTGKFAEVEKHRRGYGTM